MLSLYSYTCVLVQYSKNTLFGNELGLKVNRFSIWQYETMSVQILTCTCRCIKVVFSVGGCEIMSGPASYIHYYDSALCVSLETGVS